MFGDLVFFQFFILNTSKYDYEMTKYIQNISELTKKIIKCVILVVTNCPVFEVERIIA